MNNFGPGLENVKIICINLRRRRDRKIKMKRIFKKKNLKYSFFSAIDCHEDGYRGAKLSHCKVIKNAKEKGIKKLLIFEDDIKYINHFRKLDNIPENWDILYLGGEVNKLHGHNIDKKNKTWLRCFSFNCHAYIINMENEELVDDLLASLKEKTYYDFYIHDKIQKKYLTYMHNPMLIIQQNGYSDCEKKFVDYSLMSTSMDGFKKPDYENRNGNYVLKLAKLEEYPYVSIVTPTFNRRSMFPIAIRNFYEFKYPPEKLQWVIIEDSTNGETVKDLLPPNDKRIKYIYLDEWVSTMGKKRNICVENADYGIIVHMDDDDYYPPESIYSRVAALINYEPHGVKLVGSSEMATYDLINDASNITGDGSFSIAEGTMAYYKSFWEEKPFNNDSKTGEYIHFIGNRFNRILDMPYAFIMIAFKHGKNTVLTETVQQTNNKKTGKEYNFLENMDEETQMFIKQLRTYVINKVKLEAPNFDEI